MLALGLDIGGTKIESALLFFSTDGECPFEYQQELSFFHQDNHISLFCINRQRIATDREQGLQKVKENISKLVATTFKGTQLEIDDLAGVGIGLPGTVSSLEGTMLNGNTSLFVDVDLNLEFSSLLNFEGDIIFANDANCFALSEGLLGAGKEFSGGTLGIILGTGLGAGLYGQKTLLKGCHGGGAEVGHISLASLDERICFCGESDCAELYLSGHGFEQYVSEKYALKESATKVLESSDEKYQAAKNDYMGLLKKFLTNMANTFDPAVIVLGGGVSCFDFPFEEIEDEVYRRRFIKRPLKICKNQLGDSSGVFGAGCLVWDDFI